MADIQHADLPNNLLHEPLHILPATIADSGKVITSSSTTNGESDYRKLTVADITGEGKTSWNGWGQWADSVYTSGSPLAISPAARTRVTIDGLGSGSTTTYLPTGSSDWWDTINNKLVGDNIGDSYIVRLAFKATTGTASSHATVELDIEGTQNTILQETIGYPKGSSVEHSYVLVWPIFTLNTFITNGGKIYITPSSNGQEFYDFEIQVQKTHSEA